LVIQFLLLPQRRLAQLREANYTHFFDKVNIKI
jgi:hypothetical protein